MYAVLGEIEFKVLAGFTSLEERLGSDYAEHALIGRKPKLQFVGEKLDEVRGSLRFHHTFCDPGAELARLEQEESKHEPLALVMGNGDHKGHFVITELVIVGKQHNSIGRELAVEVEVTLKQADGTPRKRQPPGFAMGQAGGVFSELLERIPAPSNQLAKVVSGAKLALSNAKQAVGTALNVKDMLSTNPALALAHLPVALDELDVGMPLLNESGQALAGMASVAVGVATEAMAVAEGVRDVAEQGRAMRDVLAATTLDNAKEQVRLLDGAAASMLSRAEQLNAPMAVMAVKSVARRMA